MAEIELHILNGQCLNRHIAYIEKIRDEVQAWQSNRNNKDSKTNWLFRKKEARMKLKDYISQFTINITLVAIVC